MDKSEFFYISKKLGKGGKGSGETGNGSGDNDNLRYLTFETLVKDPSVDKWVEVTSIETAKKLKEKLKDLDNIKEES